MSKNSRLNSAFKENFNLVGLATLAAASAAMLNPLPLLAGVVAEAAYLLFVPDSRWYDARLSRKSDAEVERQRRELKRRILPTLRPDTQNRFSRMEAMRQEIGSLPRDEEQYFREVVRKLDYLLEKYLVFAGKEVQFRNYLTSILKEARAGEPSGWERDEEKPNLTTPLLDALFDRIFGSTPQPNRPQPNRPQKDFKRPPKPQASPTAPPSGSRDPVDRWVEQTVGEIQANYDKMADDLRQMIGAESDPQTKTILEKRLEILLRRHEFLAKIGKILINLHHQMELLEDSFGLINDQIRARSPEQVLTDIEDVTSQTEAMTQVLNEMASLEGMMTTP